LNHNKLLFHLNFYQNLLFSSRGLFGAKDKKLPKVGGVSIFFVFEFKNILAVNPLLVQNIVRPCNCPYNTSRSIWCIFKIFGTIISYGCVSGVVMALQHSIWNNKVKKH
jgi:hypothetical protein